MRLTIYFQRFTVMVSEIPLLFVLYYIFGEINIKLALAYFSIPFALLDSKPISIIDIHFQYNIIMQAIFLLAIEFIRR